MLNYRQTAVLLCIYSVTVQSIAKHSSQAAKTVRLAHSRNTSYTDLHMVFYTCWLSWTTSKFQDFPGPNSFPGLSWSWKFYRKNQGLSRCRNPELSVTWSYYPTTHPYNGFIKFQILHISYRDTICRQKNVFPFRRFACGNRDLNNVKKSKQKWEW